MKSAMVEKEGFAALVLRLRGEGISDLDLLTAVEQTPRSRFVPPQFAADAYSSRTIPIDCGAFMEGADMAVKILARLQLKPGQRVLEIGTGSGFMTAIIARRVERVFSLERYKTLVQQAQNCLDDLSIRNVVIRQADGSNGLVGEGTFDRDRRHRRLYHHAPLFRRADRLRRHDDRADHSGRRALRDDALLQDRQPLREGRAVRDALSAAWQPYCPAFVTK